MSTAWTTPANIEHQVRRRWDSGELLAAYGRGDAFPSIRVRLSGPKATEIGDDLGAARAWAESIRVASRDGRAFAVEESSVGGRVIGRTSIPGYAVVSEYAQAWRLLRVEQIVADFDLIVAASDGAALHWALRRPLRAIELVEEWGRVLIALRALEAFRGSGRRLREVSAPGIHSKFIERHRAVLAEMLGVSTGANGFLEELGLTGDPPLTRLRFAAGVGLPSGATDIAFRTGELARLELSVANALIVENKATFLSVPLPERGVVMWGQGFDVARAAAFPWLRTAMVRYWGDIDPAGFAILDRLRSALPDAVSVLMDRDTFLAHRDRWTVEKAQSGVALSRLTDPEAALYRDLVTDVFGRRVQLEQESIDWQWALDRLAG